MGALLFCSHKRRARLPAIPSASSVALRRRQQPANDEIERDRAEQDEKPPGCIVPGIEGEASDASASQASAARVPAEASEQKETGQRGRRDLNSRPGEVPNVTSTGAGGCAGKRKGCKPLWAA